MIRSIAFAALLFWSGAVFGADKPTIDLAHLVELGKDTAQELKATPYVSHVQVILQGTAVVDVISQNQEDWSHVDVALMEGATRSPLFQMTQRDGLWYVQDGQHFAKYRPWEAPAVSPIVYFAIQLSAPAFFDDVSQLRPEMLETVTDTTAVFRVPLNAAMVSQLRATVTQLKELQRQTAKELPDNLKQTMAQSIDLIERGQPLTIDRKTGQLIDRGNQRIRTRVMELKLHAQIDPQAFDVSKNRWEDFTDDPTAGNLDDLVLIGNAPATKAGDKNYELDGRLMDVRTGRFRRLPFPGPQVTGACFLQERHTVLAFGLDMLAGSVVPYKIDLQTCYCKRLGGAFMSTGISVFGAASPDGKWVLVQQANPAVTGSMLLTRLCLIDLQSGEARQLGKPIDTAHMSWTSDSKHLVLILRKYKDMTSPASTSIATMDLDGTIKELRVGDHPIVLADGKTILFEDAAGKSRTCDLNGENEKIYADGLPGYGFPTPGPDGKRIIFMHFVGGQLPEVVEMKLGATQGRRVTDAPGLWGIPQWR